MHKYTYLLLGCTSICVLSPVFHGPSDLALAYSSLVKIFNRLWAQALWLFTTHLWPLISGCLLTEGSVLLAGAGIAHSVKKNPSVSLQGQGIFWKATTNSQALFKTQLGPSVTKVLCFISLSWKGLSTSPCASSKWCSCLVWKDASKHLCPNLKKNPNETKKIVLQSQKHHANPHELIFSRGVPYL